MAKKVKEVAREEKISSSCADQFCPFHGKKPVKLRGRTFQGEVIKKFNNRIVIQFERMLFVRKYERYEKRKTKLHARLPNCLEKEINIGDTARIAECRPISKMIHFIAISKVRGKQE